MNLCYNLSAKQGAKHSAHVISFNLFDDHLGTGAGGAVPTLPIESSIAHPTSHC